MGNFTDKILAGQYHLNGLINRGRTTEIYKAWDMKYETFVAIKLMHFDLGINNVLFDCFINEARILAKLSHPNIINFYGLGQDNEDAFIVMEYIDGDTLKRRMLSTPRPIKFEYVLKIMRPLCDALHHAHSHGVIHADVKPSNILIDKGDRVVLFDFNIAQIVEDIPNLLGAGTPEYMSVEQIKGNPITQRSDIYSLGIILYELLTGNIPFDGKLAPYTDLSINKIKWEKLNITSPFLKEKNSNISPELENVIAKALSPNPLNRYMDTQDFLRAIEDVGVS